MTISAYTKSRTYTPSPPAQRLCRSRAKVALILRQVSSRTRLGTGSFTTDPPAHYALDGYSYHVQNLGNGRRTVLRNTGDQISHTTRNEAADPQACGGSDSAAQCDSRFARHVIIVRL